MLTYITDVQPGEPDILARLKYFPLKIRSLDGITLHSQDAPKEGWTHQALNEVQPESVAGGADAYLNGQWIGSTEV